MTFNLTVAILPVLCLNCTIHDTVIPGHAPGIPVTIPSIEELIPLLEKLPALLEGLGNLPPPPPPIPLPEQPLDGHHPLPAYDLNPPVQRELPSQQMKPLVLTFPMGFRQDATNPHGIMSTIVSMIAGMMPFNRHQEPEPAPAPVDVPPTHKNHEQEKAAHHDHEHVKEPAQPLPDGIVPGGYFYEGQKADGTYFNEEAPPPVALELHSPDEVSSPGKLYNDKSEHPYYVVDKPAEGPAPPPLVYFSSGLRTEDAASSAAAWNNYYAKLREYNDYYYNYYERYGRSKTKASNREETEEPRDQILLTESTSSTKS